MTLNELYNVGIKNVWSQSEKEQIGFLKLIADARGMNWEILKKAGGFFVPNEEYMIKMFGSAIEDPVFDCYRDGMCNWMHNLVLPVTNLSEKCVGFVGFNVLRYLEAKETKDWTLYYYTYSTKSVFTKGDYLYGVPGFYNKALEDGYLILVDGVFDALSYADAGFNAASALGSILTESIITQLKFIKRIIVVYDNDKAGIELYERVLKYIPKAEAIKQGKTKDVDELLKSGFRQDLIRHTKEVLEDGLQPITTVKFSKPFYKN